MKKATKITNNPDYMVQFIDENEVKSEMGEAFASFMLNPTVTWAKFILTDDRKNGNGQRIPKEEFANLIRSGIHMPVKMALGEIRPGHDDSRPLGTITHLKEITLEDGAAIVALAALWSDERPADVEFIKQRFAAKESVDISWEIKYMEEKFNDELASEDLLGTVLTAATIVGNPAYQGRTPFLAVASKSEESSSETTAEENVMDIAELEAKVAELEAKLGETQAELDTHKTLVTEKDAEIVRLTEESVTKETELASLKEYKASIEAQVAKAQKLESIKNKFVEAGLIKGDEYFAENAEKLASMDEPTLDFMVQELVASLSEDSKTSTASKKTKIPNLLGDDDEKLDAKSLAKYLREQGKK